MNLINKALLVINIFFLQAYLLRFEIFNYPSNLQEILIFIQIFFFVYVTPIKSLLRILSRHWIIISLIIFTGLSIVTIPIDNQVDFARHLKFLFFAIVLAFIFTETLKDEKEKKAAIKIMGAGAIIFGIFSAIYNLAGYNVALDFRLTGPLDAAVYLAYYFTPFFIFFLIEFFENPKIKANLIYAILLGLLIIGTRSMGSIMGSILIIAFYLFKRSNLKILKNKTLVGIMVGIFIIAGSAVIYSKILPTIKTDYSSLDERGEIWKTSFDLLKSPETVLFGTGFGQFQQHYFETVDKSLGHKPLDYYVLQPHNIFLLFLMQYGILGLAFIIYCIYLTLKNIFRFSKKPDLQIISCFVILYFFVHGLIDTPIFKNDLLILFILFLELALIPTPNPLKPHKNPLLSQRLKPTKRR